MTDRLAKASDIPVFGNYLETSLTKGMADGDNYGKLGYGFCTFCDPTSGHCQSEFEAYLQTGDNVNMFSFIGRLANTEPFKSLQEYAH